MEMNYATQLYEAFSYLNTDPEFSNFLKVKLLLALNGKHLKKVKGVKVSLIFFP